MPAILTIVTTDDLIELANSQSERAINDDLSLLLQRDERARKAVATAKEASSCLKKIERHIR